jgi:glycosyltransferase involved in cell wall biosynthesis
MDCPSGPAEILEGGKAGMLTPAGDQAAFEAALVLLMTSPETREKYVAAGKAQANRFAASRVLPMWEQVLDDVLMSHRKRRR